MKRNPLDGLTNLFGPLSPTMRARLAAYLAKPTRKKWDNIYGIVIDGDSFCTVWQAVLAIDPHFQSRSHLDAPLAERWPVIPSVFTLRRALQLQEECDDSAMR